MNQVSRAPRIVASLLVTAVACAVPTFSVVVSFRIDDLRTTVLAVNATAVSDTASISAIAVDSTGSMCSYCS